MISKLLTRGLSFAALLTAALHFGSPRAEAAPVVYLAGDSTVMTYKSGYNLYPQQGWGGRLHEYFTSDVTFSNKAIGGRSSKSFVDEGRLADILNQIKPGDYLFIQFGHNDGNSKPALHTDPFTTFKTYLSLYIDGAVSRGATPVLVTPVGRRNYNSSGQFINDFVDRCTAMKQLAAQKNCKLIDLNAKSIAYYTAIGVDATRGIFLWLDAGQYPNFPNGIRDATHFQENGANQLARLVKDGISEINLPIKSFIKTSAGPIPGGTYSLRNVASGKMLDNLGATGNGSAVGQWTDGSSNNQKWVVTHVSGSTYKLSCVTGGKFLDSLGSTADGASVGQWSSSSSANQQWTVTVSGSNYTLTNVASGKCLDTGGGTANGSVMRLGTRGSGNTQLWQFVAP